ncbi:MAG: DUF6364 family protein [Chitinispirillia bacterium]|nr:DUF6364 family protein [Chitinispirillia bacterium]MCL2269222.1 DUF6364 family protein [Chitinispirillia bacterium]
METKLTLKLDRSVIDSAKEYAKNSHKSLSKLVEDFFKSLAYENSPPEKYPLLIENLSGIISEEDLERVSKEDERARYILRGDR